MIKGRPVWSRGGYDVVVRLYDDGTGGSVDVWKGDCAEYQQWEFRNPPGFWWWQRSLQSAVLKAMTWVQRRVAKEMENAAHLEVVREIVNDLPELLP